MKLASAIGFLGVVLSGTALVAGEQIPWAADFKTACGMAAEQHRLVLLHFFNDNCAPCVRLEQNVFNQQSVGEAVAQNYLALKVHVGKNPQLAARYRIQQWPTDVFVTPSGLEVFRTVSPQKPEQYIALLNQVAQQTGVGAARQWTSHLLKTNPDGSRPPFQPSESTRARPEPAAKSQAPVQPASASEVAAQAPAAQPDSPANSTEVAPPSTGLTNQYQQATESVLDRRSAFTPVEQSPAAAAAAASTAVPATSSQATAASSPPTITNNPWIVATPPPAQAAPEFPNHQMIPRHQAPPVALDGFCPVTLMDAMAQNRLDRSAWKKGDERFGAIHEGRTYLFASAENQRKFLDNPVAYAPLLSGCDPVAFAERGQMVPGKRCYGLLTVDRHMYLFADEASFNRFKASPANFTAAVQQAMSRNQTTSIYR
jgi:YHS domain-containing protein/thioredoxin-related protein